MTNTQQKEQTMKIEDLMIDSMMTMTRDEVQDQVHSMDMRTLTRLRTALALRTVEQSNADFQQVYDVVDQESTSRAVAIIHG